MGILEFIIVVLIILVLGLVLLLKIGIKYDMEKLQEENLNLKEEIRKYKSKKSKKRDKKLGGKK